MTFWDESLSKTTFLSLWGSVMLCTFYSPLTPVVGFHWVCYCLASHFSNASLFRVKPGMGFPPDKTQHWRPWNGLLKAQICSIWKSKREQRRHHEYRHDLQYKAVPGRPAKIRYGYSLIAMIKHSPERKHAIITALYNISSSTKRQLKRKRKSKSKKSIWVCKWSSLNSFSSFSFDYF